MEWWIVAVTALASGTAVWLIFSRVKNKAEEEGHIDYFNEAEAK